MHLTYAATRIQQALDAETASDRLGHIRTSLQHLKVAEKDATKDAMDESAGQLSLPIAPPAALPGSEVAVAGNGVVLTPADEASISEDDAKRAHRRGRGRPKVIDDELPTETEFKAAEIEAAAAAAVAEPDWASV